MPGSRPWSVLVIGGHDWPHEIEVKWRAKSRRRYDTEACRCDLCSAASDWTRLAQSLITWPRKLILDGPSGTPDDRSEGRPGRGPGERSPADAVCSLGRGRPSTARPPPSPRPCGWQVDRSGRSELSGLTLRSRSVSRLPQWARLTRWTTHSVCSDVHHPLRWIRVRIE